MMSAVDPLALFRLSVLGPLVSRERLERGARVCMMALSGTA